VDIEVVEKQMIPAHSKASKSGAFFFASTFHIHQQAIFQRKRKPKKEKESIDYGGRGNKARRNGINAGTCHGMCLCRSSLLCFERWHVSARRNLLFFLISEYDQKKPPKKGALQL